jgi:hypothetical protein
MIHRSVGLRGMGGPDFLGEKRVQGGPRGPGGPPHRVSAVKTQP